MSFKLNTCKHITWCRKVKKTVIWWPRKTNETDHFKIKTWEGFNLAILKVNKSIMIEWKITINLNSKSKSPQVELTNTTTCSSDSRLFYIGFAKHKFPVCDFEISLKGFRSPSVVDLYVATCFLQFLMVDLILVDICWVRRYRNLTNLTVVTQKTSMGF